MLFVVECGYDAKGDFMKKLVYNENTKEIDVMEKKHSPEKDEKEPRKVKKWLEENKIFFDIVSTFCVGAMGVVISFVGWKTNQRSADIYQRQLEILDNDREPYFTINSEITYQSLEEDSYFIQSKYVIKNEGGLIIEAFTKDVKSYAVVDVYIPNGVELKRLCFKYEINKFSVLDRISYYDKETKELAFYGIKNSEYENFRAELEDKLNKILNNCYVFVGYEDYIEISYINYKNEKNVKKYRFIGDSLAINDDDKNYIRIMQRDDVDLIAQEIFEYVKEWEGSPNK